VVVSIAPEPEEGRQLAGARSAVLGCKTAGRQLSVLAVASCCSKTCSARHDSEAQSQHAVAMDGDLHHWAVGLARSHLFAVHTELGVPVQVAQEREQSFVVHETGNEAVGW